MDQQQFDVPPGYDPVEAQRSSGRVVEAPGFGRAFRMSFGSPMVLGRSLPERGAMSEGILIALIAHLSLWVGWIVIGTLLVALLLGVGASGGNMTGGEAAAGTLAMLAFSLMVATGSALGMVFIALPIGALGLWIAAQVLGASRGGYLTTLRTVYYGQAPLVIGVVPYFGSLVGGIWAIVSIISHLAGARELSGLRATAAYFLAMVFNSILMFGVWIVVGLVAIALGA